MKRFLSTLTLLLCFAFTAVNAQDNYDATTMGNIVRYYETAKWAQGSPFNNQCWTNATQQTHAKTGCVPTAFAIIMRHHGFPAEGIGNLLNQQTGEQFTDRTYDYSKMPLTNGSGWTTEQQNEVAKLMAHLGHAFGVTFGQGTTSVSIGNTMSERMQNFFNYNYAPVSNQYAGSGQMYDFEEWKKNLKNSLDNGCPVPYAADNKQNGTNDTRHMFVIDGYTENEYFHFNFGWGGGSNGWYKLDNITPTGDDYSWRTTSDGYDSKHQAFFNLMPNKTKRTVTASVSPTGAGKVTVNGSENSAEVIEGTTATLVATANDGYTFSHWSKGGTEVGTEMTYKAKVAAEGNEYVANFHTIGSSINIPVNYDSNMGSVTYDGNIVSATGFNPNEYSEVTLTAEANDGYMFTGWEIVEGIETTKSSEKSITFIAKSGITVNANFALAGGEYKINSSNITPSATGKCSTWTYSKEGDIEGILTLSTANGSTVVNALGTSNRLYAHAYDDKNNGYREITYTLTAKEGFVITGYSLTYVVSKAGQVTVRNATQTQTPSDTQQYTLTYQYANAARSTAYGTRSTEFVLSSTTDSNTQYITIKDLSVTVLSEGAEGGSTPTPDPEPEPDPTPTTYTVTTTANPAAGGTAKFAVGTGSQKIQGDVENGTQITLYAVANTGYNFVNWTLGGNVVGTAATCNVTVSQTANYVANFEAVQQGGSSSTNLADKYFRLKDKRTGNYMTVENTNYDAGTTSIIVSADNRGDAQIFCFEQSGNGYKIKQRNGNYLNCDRWSVHANADHAAVVFTLESTTEELEYLIKWENNNHYNEGGECPDYFKVESSKVYCDAAQNAAATWVLEEVVYYTVTATAGEGGSVSPLTSTVEQGKPVTLIATANSGYRFVNWTLNGNVVSTDASYTFNATAAGEYVANFEIITYNISATANPGTAGSVTINGEAVSSKNVNGNSTVTLVATPQAGYCFVNWTLNGNVVSADASYKFNATAAGEYVANFEQIVVNVTLTDAQSNTYNVQLSGFTNGVKTATVATKLTEKYPYITLGDNATLNGSNAAYTYSNKVTLPFKVSSVSDATKTYWYNIYYPSNGDARNPNYIAALNNEDKVVDMAASPKYAYGENPTYNTKAGNPMISWAVYSVNNSFEFVFKNELTNNYIKVESVSSSTTNNVKFVENAGDATAFSLLKDATDSYNGDYALVANTGYLCATSSDENYVTHFDRNDREGAWVKFVEVDYGQYIGVLDTKLRKFDVGNDKHMITGEIQPMINALVDNNGVNITKSQFEAYFKAIDDMDAENWPKISLTIAPDNSGTTTIAGEEGVTRKYVPTGDLTINATPAEGYHFVSWTSGTNEVSTDANYEFNITAATALTANFAKNSYTVSVTAGEGGSASASTTTVEHGGEVTLTAVANDGYKFSGWYNGETKVSAEATYTVTNVTSDINYTARFEEEAGETPTTHAIHIVTVDTNGNPLTNNATGPVKAVINIGGRDWVTDEDFDNGATVDLVATSDFNQSAYLFDGWYKNGVFVSMKSEITVTVTETATYQARFIKGYVVTLASDNKTEGYPNMITYPDGSPVVGAATELKAVVKPNEEVLISINPNYGFRVANWTDKDGNEVAGKNANSFILEITGDNKYTAHIEQATYTLSVSTQQGTMGSVHIGDGTETSVTVNNGETATITATPNSGYKFVNWTLNGVVVSTENTYNVPAITDNVQYVAVFAEADALDAGYYRIAYDFPVAVAAKSAATRAVGDTYTINSNTGVLNNSKSSKYTEWIDNTIDATELSLRATNSDGTPVYAIKKANGDYYYQFHAYTCDNSSTYSTSTKYTLSVSGNYIIKECSITYKQNAAGQVTISYGDKSDAFNNTSDNTLSLSPNAQTVEFTLTSSARSANYYLHIKNFTVTIQPVGGESEGGGETPEPEPGTPSIERYYMQSVACGVSGGNNLQNALKMTQKTDAASIFYYTGDKLLSYDKGTYVNENGGTRGLQAVGAYGDATIKVVGTNDEDENICTVAAPNYMHANSNGTTYYVDHCGSNPDNHAANHNFVLEEVTSLPVTITDAGYATWYAPVAVQLPDGLTAYTITIHGDYAITGDGFKQVPANTGVILEGTKGTTYELEIIGSAPEVESIMEGTVAATYFPENDYAYVLSTDKGTRELGFYMADDGEASWSHKAYLPKSAIPAGAQMSAGFRLILPGTTAIEVVETENNIDAIYDLTGRKLEGISGTGIYIINGKKVIVR